MAAAKDAWLLCVYVCAFACNACSHVAAVCVHVCITNAYVLINQWCRACGGYLQRRQTLCCVTWRLYTCSLQSGVMSCPGPQRLSREGGMKSEARTLGHTFMVQQRAAL